MTCSIMLISLAVAWHSTCGLLQTIYPGNVLISLRSISGRPRCVLSSGATSKNCETTRILRVYVIIPPCVPLVDTLVNDADALSAIAPVSPPPKTLDSAAAPASSKLPIGLFNRFFEMSIYDIDTSTPMFAVCVQIRTFTLSLTAYSDKIPSPVIRSTAHSAMSVSEYPTMVVSRGIAPHG